MRLSAKRPGWLVLGSGRQLSDAALFRLLQLGGWSAFGIMMLGYELVWQSPREAAVADAVMVATGVGLTTVARHIYRFLGRRGAPALACIGAAIVFAIAGSATWFLLQEFIIGMVRGRRYLGWHPLLMLSGLDAEVFLYNIFILLTWTLLYYGIKGWVKLELERRRADRAEASAQAARLQALQSQLEPHFLFNTLNGISALVADGRSEAANAMIARLSDFLRLTLKTCGTPEITLASDLSFVRQYLEIQQLRFGERLHYEFSVAPQALDALVPALLLQPLVENAVRHGILPRASGGKLVVSARTALDSLLLGVDDDGPGIQKSAQPSTGLGLSNTATRLAELYGARAEIRVGRSDLGGAGVAIRIPLRVDTGAIAQPAPHGAEP
jgi:signal transduction histidine kinase